MANQTNPYTAPQSDLWPAGKSHPGNMAFGDAPIATFRLVLDARWFERGYTRWAKAYASPLSALLSLLALGVAIALFLFFSAPNRGGGLLVRLPLSILFGGMLSLPFFAGWVFHRWFTRSAVVRQFRTCKEFGVVCHFTLYREGLALSCPTMITARQWSGFWSSRRFSDGILIMLDTRQFHWLPWVDLESGKPDDVDAILRANIADYKEIRH